MIIEVTQEDIRRGVPRSRCHCPIALALKRLGLDPLVSSHVVLIGDRDPYDLPSEARVFITSFDRDIEVHPFTFELPLEKD